MKYLLPLLLLVLLSPSLSGQELNLDVQVTAGRTTKIDPKVFQTLEKELEAFFNNTKWTEDEFEDFEKIEGSLNVTVTEDLSANSFSADIFMQTIRPVYQSNYKSPVLNYVDKGLIISYTELQPIQNSFNNYIDPLSSLMTYYAYLMLGFDYDSFAPFGGDEHFRTVQNVLSSVPQSAAAGTAWDVAFKSNTSRYNIITELLSPRGRPYRQAMHEYHIKSLDKMHEDPSKARAVMMSAITAVDQVNSSILNSGIIQMFGDCKRDEIIEIFKGAGRGDQTKIYELMIRIDPSRTSRYSAIR